MKIELTSREAKHTRGLIAPLALALAFTLLSAPAVSAQPNKPIRCEMTWYIDYTRLGLVPPELGWTGPVWGDINGDITVTLVYAKWTGKEGDRTEHWIEEWVIETETGDICGRDKGEGTMGNGRCNAKGRITDATGEWEDLIGCRFHWKGWAYMTDPGPPAQWRCDLTMIILPST